MNLNEFLATVPEFDGLSGQDIDTLSTIMVVREFSDGHEFVREDASAQDVYIVVDGEIAVTHKRGKQRGFLDIKHLHAGEMFGLLSLIDDGKHEASCKAVGPVTVATLPRQAFKLLYDSNVPIAFHFQRVVGRQLMRDYRTLNRLLRAVAFAEDEENAEAAMRSILNEYQGPERRKGDRRKISPQAVGDETTASG